MQTDTKATSIDIREKFKSFLYRKSFTKRIWELDFIRGLCIALMIMDHFMMLIYAEFSFAWCNVTYNAISNSFVYDGLASSVWICNLAQNYINGSLRFYGHIVVVFLFFSICGISCSLSKSNLKRGLILAAVALVWSVATYIGEYVLDMGQIFVHFGVLHFLAFCILFYCLLDYICFKNKIAKMAISGAIVVVVMVLYHYYRPDHSIDGIFAFVFDNSSEYGIPIEFNYHFNNLSSFSPGDYFSIIPWSAFFFFGTFIQPYLYSEKKSLLPKLDHKWQKPLSFLGRHGLIIYILHVIILAVVLMLISVIFLTPGNWVLF